MSIIEIKQNHQDILFVEDPIIIDEDGCEMLTKDQLYNNILTKYNLNSLKTDIIKWKIGKARHTYVNEPGWTYIGEIQPDNNFILYLLENMPENISAASRCYWKSADTVGLDKEAKDIFNIESLGRKDGENFWIDKRVLGKNWKALFDSITEADNPITMDIPEPPN